MTPISQTKLALYQERHFTTRMPVTVDVALTDFCTFRCRYCRYRKGHSQITAQEFEAMLGRFVEWGVRGITLTGGGEPLLNKDFEQIGALLAARGWPHGVNTNFSVYRHMMPTWVKFSVHGETDETCMRNYTRFRKEHPKTTAGIQFVARKPGESGKLWEKYRWLDCDYISIRPVEAMRSVYSVEEVELIGTEIANLSKLDSRVHANFKWGFARRGYPNCLANWSALFIDANGRVPYCCHKPLEIVGRWDDPDILTKREGFRSTDPCDIPCRQSGNNWQAGLWEEPQHPEFV